MTASFSVITKRGAGHERASGSSVQPVPHLPEASAPWSKQQASRIRDLVREHCRFVWRSLRRLGVAEADADDAMQQVFWVAARKIDQVQPDRERSFLFGTAVRVAADHRRTLRRRREDVEGDGRDRVDPCPSPEQVASDRHALAVLDGILDGMPEDLRVVFVLYEIEEMQMSEMAEWLGLPMGTVASRLRRARERFEAAAQKAREPVRMRRGA